MAEVTFQTIIFSLLAGALPALVWLWFWLREDSLHPEPRRMVIAAFLAGIFAIPIVLFLEHFVHKILPQGTLLITSWAAIEEVVKYLAAYFVAFRLFCVDGTKCLDEPVDPLIYLITVALGFAAVENTLFLITPFTNGEFVAGLLTGNLRFVGATVLHVVASSLVGIAMGITYYKRGIIKFIAICIGLFTAIVLHTAFNLSIINNNNAEEIFVTFGLLWIGVVVLLLFFEKIKGIRKPY